MPPSCVTLPRVRPVLSQPTSSSLSVEWQAGLNDDDLADVSHFALQWRVVGKVNGLGEVVPEETPSKWQASQASQHLQSVRCVKKGLIPGTAYIFRVKAIDAEGNGSWGPLSAPLATLHDDAPRPPERTTVDVGCHWRVGVSLGAPQQDLLVAPGETPEAQPPRAARRLSQGDCHFLVRRCQCTALP